jgi:hypothetical protein
MDNAMQTHKQTCRFRLAFPWACPEPVLTNHRFPSGTEETNECNFFSFFFLFFRAMNRRMDTVDGWMDQAKAPAPHLRIVG